MSKKTKTASDDGLKFSFDSIGEIHSDIQENSSEPSTAAVEQHTAETLEQEVIKTESTSGVRDSTGALFNAEIHATNADGEPSITPAGKFRKRRGASKVSTTNQTVREAQDQAAKEQAARAAGQLAADLMIGSCVGMLGDEWQPIGAQGTQQAIQFDEHSNLRRAFGDYFVAKGINDFPPGVMLSIAMTSYIMPRVVAGKETQSRLSRAKVWIANKYYSIKKVKKNATQSDTRDDGKRQDNASKETMRDVESKATRHAST